MRLTAAPALGHLAALALCAAAAACGARGTSRTPALAAPPPRMCLAPGPETPNHLNVLRGWVGRPESLFVAWRAEVGLRPADTAAIAPVTDERLCARLAAAAERAAPGRRATGRPAYVYRVGDLYAVDDPVGGVHWTPMWFFDRRIRRRGSFGY